jgi:hypothetical protein
MFMFMFMFMFMCMCMCMCMCHDPCRRFFLNRKMTACVKNLPIKCAFFSCVAFLLVTGHCFSWADFFNRWHQSYQMVCFKTKNTNLDKSWRALDWKKFKYFMAIWNILWRFVIFYNHWVHFVFIWYHVPRKIWQPWLTPCQICNLYPWKADKPPRQASSLRLSVVWIRSSRFAIPRKLSTPKGFQVLNLN